MTYEPAMNPINDSTQTSDISTSENDFESRPIERDDDCGTENESDSSYQLSDATSDEDLVVNSRNNIDDIRLYATPDPTKYNKQMFLTNTTIHKILQVGSLKLPKTFQKQKSKSSSLKRKDAVATSIRVAENLITKGAFQIRRIEDNDDPIMKVADGFECPSDIDVPGVGWARRQRGQKTYGVSYLSEYSDDIEELFNRGQKSKSKKMNASIMQSHLKNRYPGVFSIPSETEIKQEIGRLFQKSKKKDIMVTENEDGELIGNSQSTRQRHIGEWVDVLKEIVLANRTMRPEQLWSIFDKQVVEQNLDVQIKKDAMKELI